MGEHTLTPEEQSLDVLVRPIAPAGACDDAGDQGDEAPSRPLVDSVGGEFTHSRMRSQCPWLYRAESGG